MFAGDSDESSANDGELSLFDTGAAEKVQSTGTPVTEDSPVDEIADDGGEPAPSAREAVIPEPIEDQINTSMTQTLKALNVKPPISDQLANNMSDEDGEDGRKSGFFSRFRRS